MGLYEILGVPRDASQEDIKKAYRKLSKTTHPDTPEGSAEKFAPISMAYRILSDPEKRAKYDETGTYDDAPSQQRTPGLESLAQVYQTVSREMAQGGLAAMMTGKAGRAEQKTFIQESLTKTMEKL